MKDGLDIGPSCNEPVTQELTSSFVGFSLCVCVCVYLIAPMFKSYRFLPKNSNVCLLLKDDLVTLGPHY